MERREEQRESDTALSPSTSAAFSSSATARTEHWVASSAMRCGAVEPRPGVSGIVFRDGRLLEDSGPLPEAPRMDRFRKRVTHDRYASLQRNARTASAMGASRKTVATDSPERRPAVNGTEALSDDDNGLTPIPRQVTSTLTSPPLASLEGRQPEPRGEENRVVRPP